MKQFAASPLPRRKTGRPLSFDRDAALEQAMLAFWRHGYETTSVADLTRAMGVTPPSLYAAFGDKKRLFLEATDRYAGDPAAMALAIEAAPSAYEAGRSMLLAAANAFTGETTPRGCLLASATASGSAASADVRGRVAEIRIAIMGMLRDRIDRDIATGLLPSDTNAASFAAMLMAVTQGMSTLARDGMSREALIDIVDATMRAWPAVDGHVDGHGAACYNTAAS